MKLARNIWRVRGQRHFDRLGNDQWVVWSVLGEGWGWEEGEELELRRDVRTGNLITGAAIIKSRHFAPGSSSLPRGAKKSERTRVKYPHFTGRPGDLEDLVIKFAPGVATVPRETAAGIGASFCGKLGVISGLDRTTPLPAARKQISNNHFQPHRSTPCLPPR